MFVNNFTDMMKNIGILNRYRKSNIRTENDYYRTIIGKGFCFVVVEINGKLYFAPSRFVGYHDNSAEKHDRNENKDGRDTNPVIDSILGKHEKNDAIETEFLKFCEQNDIKTDNRERKYWRVQKLPNVKWF